MLHSAFACTLTANVIDDQLPMKQFSVFRVDCQLLWKNTIDIVADKYYFSKSIQELSTTTNRFIELLLAWVHCLAWKITNVLLTHGILGMIHIPVMVIESGMVLNPVLGRMSVLNHKLGSLPLRSRPDETVFSLKCETVTVRSGYLAFS